MKKSIGEREKQWTVCKSEVLDSMDKVRVRKKRESKAREGHRERETEK